MNEENEQEIIKLLREISQKLDDVNASIKESAKTVYDAIRYFSP